MSREAVDCAHCGVPVPRALIVAGAEMQFCCEGCRTVFEVLHGEGLEAYYALREEQDTPPRPARTTGRRYEEFDAPAFFERYARMVGDDRAEIELHLEGVHCAACVWLLEKVPRLVDGVLEVQLDFPRSRALVGWNPSRVSLSRVARALDSLGYPPHPFRRLRSEQAARAEDRRMLLRLGITGAAAGNVMLIAFALYGGMLHGMAPQYESFFRWISLLLTVPALIWGGGVFFRGAWSAARTRTLHMDLPISIGILAGAAWGAINTLRGAGEIYFESVTALIFLLLAGRLIQRRRQRAAADAASMVHSLFPRTARLIDSPQSAPGSSREVPVETLLAGMLVELLAGDVVPADGTIVAGESAFDLSLLTGESRPVDLAERETVYGGSVNLSQRVVLRVDSTGEQTRVGQLMRLVESFSRRKAPIVQLADRISGWFTAAVLGLAALTLIVWIALDPDHPAIAVGNAVALLIVTCPCALGLATPLAVSAALGQAARAGILMRGADVIERLARPGRLWLDKTGTLTEGRMSLVSWSGSDALARLVAQAESASTHPVGVALREGLERRGADRGTTEIESAEQLQGRGIAAQAQGRALLIGSPEYISAQLALSADDPALREVASLTAEGLTPVLVAWDGRVQGVAALGDPLRPEAGEALRRLVGWGWKLGILSGDHPLVVQNVATKLGLDPEVCEGGLLPEEKLRRVTVEGEHPVTMVGDGVNDAAALAAADVGIAVHGGAEAALAAADVYLTRAGLSPLLDLLSGVQRTMRVIRRNLVFSLVYNLAGAALAITGAIDPLIAAILMPVSSLTVVTYSYRARTFDEPDKAAASTRARSQTGGAEPAP